jgi:2-polyprenyl-6-methoxyphenol hydroxylase-like FAD-dependent oxidoreductase
MTNPSRFHSPDIAIVGGGIAGLCAAIALQEQGNEVTVYEAATDLRATGAGLWIPPNGVAALNHLGVANELLDRGICIERTEIRTTDKTPLVSTDIASLATELGYDHPLLAVHRGDLIDVLAAELPEAAIRRDRRCESVNTATPAVSFADGATVSPTVVVGADGIASTVRDEVAPSSTLEYAGAVAYRGVTETALPDEAFETGTVYWGDAGSFGYSAIGSDRAWWFASIPATQPEATPEGSPSVLQERYANYPYPVPQLIEDTGSEALIRTPLSTLHSLTTWTRGQVALVGDAAHAMPPTLSQGSAQAMEDAVALERTIDQHGLTPTGLTAYESQRKSRAEALIRMSRVQGRLARLSNPVVTKLRDVLFRITPDSVVQRQSRQMFATEMGSRT